MSEEYTHVTTMSDIPTTTVSPPQLSVSLLQRVALYMLRVFGFLLPIFFLPTLSVVSDVPVSLMLAIVVGIVGCAYYVLIFRRGSLIFPHTVFFWILGLVNVVFGISTILSDQISHSFVGFGGDVGTSGFVFLVSSLLVLTALVYNTKDHIFSSYILFFIAFIIVALHHLLRLIFGADFLSFDIFTNQTASILGSWNNVAIFFGASVLIALITLHMLSLSRPVRLAMYAMVYVSLFFLILVNFLPVWIVVGLISCVLSVYYRFYRNTRMEGAGTRGQQHVSIVVCICALIFIIGGNSIHPPIAQTFDVAVGEVRPSWTATIEVGKQILSHHFFFGSGPNTFRENWITYKPTHINETIFYAVDFNSGVAFIPTLAVTTGALGVLSMVLLVLSFIYVGYRVLTQHIRDVFTAYLVTSSFAIALYLWVMLVVYTPSASMLALTFFFSGLFFAIAIQEHLIPVYTIPFAQVAKTGFITVITLVSLVALTVFCAYSFIRSDISQIYYARAIKAAQTDEGIPRAEILITQANALEPHGLYYRSLADIDLYYLNNVVVSETATDKTPEVLRTEFQTHLTDALTAMNHAIAIEPHEYQNGLKIGQIYTAVAAPPFSISGAYENAKQSFAEAERLNPTNPVISLMNARLALTQNDIEAAREFIATALGKKSNYLEAHFLLSQIEAAHGNLAEAIVAAKNSALLAPDNPGIFFQLGLLYYNAKRYQDAITALEQAIILVPEYSNAKYFLGLTLEKVGRRDEAIGLFEDILKLNPDNQEVVLILDNLKQGKPPFLGAEPPVDAQPEQRDELPLDM